MLIDTHCHINLPEYFANPDAEIAYATSEGVEILIAVGVEPTSSQQALDLAERHPGVYAVVGWHPNSTANYTRDAIEVLERMLQHPKAVALGEIGLDYHWDHATKEQQMTALVDQMALARKVSKPVVFHCREAYPDLLDFLETQPAHPYLLHCFAGDSDDAKRAIALDCYFGVDGPISYKKASDLREVVRSLPRDRIVIETDAPFLTPEPFRGKTNRPGYVRYVNEALAKCLEISIEDCAALTTANAARFFTLSSS